MNVLDLHFARPALLAALALPLVVWWLSRRPRRPVETATGTLAVWREVAGEAHPVAARRRRRVPWSILAALTLGALALAGPRSARAAPPVWRIALDRSPSMFLPHGAGGTRLERALAAASAELERRGATDRRWLTYDGTGFVEAPGAAPPADWRRPPTVPHPEPDWASLDLPRTFWVSDAAPPRAPRDAGLVLSGGEAVSGPAAVEADGTVLIFDELQLRPSPARAPVRSVFIGPSVPEPVRALAEVWAGERGLDLVQAKQPGAALSIEGPPPGERTRARIGRDGWELDVAAAPASWPPARAPGELAALPWLESDGVAFVRGAPGRLWLSFDEAAEPRGDPAAFAVSWAALLDSVLPPPAGIVPVEERLAAGAALVSSPQAASGEDSERAPGPPLEAFLAAGATLLVLLGLRGPL